MITEHKKIRLPLILEIAERSGRATPSEKRMGKNVYETLADCFDLSQDDLDKETTDKENKWGNMVRWVRNDLVKLNVISNSESGVWELTDKGWEIVNKYYKQETNREALKKEIEELGSKTSEI